MFKPLPTSSTISIPLFLGLLITLAPACDDAGDGGETPPDVIEIADQVSIDEFCAIADQIQCRAQQDCCSDSRIQYASVDECVADSPCQREFAPLLESALIADGIVEYDPSAAADFLREQVTRADACGAVSGALRGLPFLTGRRLEGETCRGESDADPAGALSCAPGLVCAQAFDETTGESVGTCQVAPAIGGPLGGHGDACSSDEECFNGTCDSASNLCTVDADQLYCPQAPEITAPSNATIDHLYLKTRNANHAGTSASVTIELYYDGKRYYCSVNPTSKNAEYTCDPNSHSQVHAWEIWTVSQPSNDGLLFDTLCARESDNSAITCAGTFNWGSSYCSGCNWLGTSCHSCWVDGDQNGSCNALQVGLSNNVSCLD